MKINTKQKLAMNTATSLVHQVVVVFCGFIVPRYIIGFYGSTVNGLISSINQFLQIIAFLELGMGSVIQTSLYKPLHEKDYEAISKIWVSANKFFHNICKILLGYIVALIIIYPRLSNQPFDFLYIALLIVVLSISSLTQYYFGIVNQLLITADQRGYVQYILQTGTYILNVLCSVILIKKGFHIQVVKGVTASIFMLRPIVLYFYVKKKYNIDKNMTYDEEPIKQKWNGISQHIAAVVLDSTDQIVLTIFSTMQTVSVYSVYHLVIYGVKTLFSSVTGGIQALLGEVWAEGNKEKLSNLFSNVEWALHMLVVFVFGCTGVLIIPFVRVYTNGVTDTEYILPIFAMVLTIAHGLHCLRLPYHMMIKAAGHYKQTQVNYIIAAAINLVVSIATVRVYGLIGVAIATLTSMVYQTVWMIIYNSKHLINRPALGIIKLLCVDIVICVSSTFFCLMLPFSKLTYPAWIILAIKCVFIWGSIIVLTNILFKFKDVQKLVSIIKHD